MWDSQDTELIRHTPESHHNVSQRSHLKGTLQGSGLHCRVSGHFEDRRCQPTIGAFGSRTFPSLCDRRHRHAEIWPRLSSNVVRHLCSAGFIRVIRDRPVAQLIAARKSSVHAGVCLRGTRIGEQPNSGALGEWHRRIDRLAARWNSKLEADAVACEYRAQEHVSKAIALPSSSPRKPGSKKSGRVPRLACDFVGFAARLWLEATRDSGQAKVSIKQLAQIGSKLDEKGYVPPADYLEGRYAKELKAFNSRNSNSKTGAIQTWSRLVSLADKDHLRGMRRMLSRCAEKQTVP